MKRTGSSLNQRINERRATDGGDAGTVVSDRTRPRYGLRRHLGWCLEGTSAALDPLLFLQLVSELRCLPSLAVFIALTYAPLYAAQQLPPAAVAAIPPLARPEIPSYLALLLIAMPLAFIQQHRIATLAHEASSKSAGGGAIGWRAYVYSWKWLTVGGDGAMLAVILCAAYAARYGAVRAAAGNVAAAAVAEVATVACEALVLSYTAHTLRLERMGVNTRGQKAAFIETRLPYFLGFGMPFAALLRWLYGGHPSVAPAAWAVLAAASTAAAAAVRPDAMGRPHASLRLVSVPHRMLAIFAPWVSGRGIA